MAVQFSQGMRIVWGDIETTGLDEHEDVILEVGLRVTDWYGEEKQRITLPVWSPGWKQLLARDSAAYVKEMHINSGLVDTLVAIEMSVSNKLNVVGPVTQEIKLIDWFDEFAGISEGPIDGKYAFAGNSVSLDRRFLYKYMPRLNDRFHYRNLDMSAIGEAMRYANPTLHARLSEGVAGAPKKHRPQDDIDNSIAYWKFYIDNFFFEDEE